MGINLENYYTISGLKSYLCKCETELEDKLNSITAYFFNRANASQDIVDWFNNLIDDYNTSVDAQHPEEIDKDYAQQNAKTNWLIFNLFDRLVPFLSVYAKLTVFLDLCILSDDDVETEYNLYSNHFEKCVHKLTEYAEKIDLINSLDYYSFDEQILFLIGYYNFQIRKYDKAIKYLMACEEIQSIKITNDESVIAYLTTIHYLAESCEYNDADSNGIDMALSYLIGINGEELKQCVSNNSHDISIKLFNAYNNHSDETDFLKELYQFFYDAAKRKPLTMRVFSLGIGEPLKTYIHVTAHCISEFASNKMNSISKMVYNDEVVSEIKAYVLLQQISRYLIDWLVSKNGYYVTCQATIRAENAATPEAIDLLLKRLKQFKDDTDLTEAERKEKAELHFYIFYFAEQEIGINKNKTNIIKILNDNGNEFLKYAKSENDKNAMFHYYVIRFKYLLKKGMLDFLIGIENADYSELDHIYYEIETSILEVSQYVFQGLVNECKRLIHFYSLFTQYRYLYTKDLDQNILQELSVRLRSQKTLYSYDLSDSESLDPSGDETSSDSDKIIDSLKSIINELEQRNHILILSPVRFAPSCSKDYLPIHHMKRIIYHISDTESYDSNYFDSINNIALELNDKNCQQKYVNCDNLSLVKWVLYRHFTTKSLFLYYPEQEYGECGELLEIKLNENENHYINDLLTSLNNTLFQRCEFRAHLASCTRAEHHQLYGEHGACMTRISQGRVVRNNPRLLELLSFAQFDFFASNSISRIEETDQIVFCQERNFYGNGYKIICLSSLPDSEEESICHFCTITDKPLKSEDSSRQKDSTFSKESEQILIPQKCKYQGKTVDFIKTRTKAQESVQMLKRESTFSDNQITKGYQLIIDNIDTICLEGTCPFSYNGDQCDKVLIPSKLNDILVFEDE